MEQDKISTFQDTITAVSTPPGIGGIAVIRVSGPEALKIVNHAWKGADLTGIPSHTVHFGKYINTEDKIIDEAVVAVFKAPRSFTGEDVVEISMHGSKWIQREILADLVKRGVRIAEPGEFTKRAFLNGKIDLAQAEGIADLIAASSKAAHDLAISQLNGSFSKEFELLREKLIEFASLIELELDFSEEEVEFADRQALINLLDSILKKIQSLADSFAKGAVLKDGVPVVIAGIPNAGKSSLLNLLLGHDKAIVTDIPGTTRDILDDTTEIEGILYRFIDTAGIRNTDDVVEKIGVDRAKEAIKKAFLVIWLIDPSQPLLPQEEELEKFINENPSKPVIILVNKADLNPNLSASSLDFLGNFSNSSQQNQSSNIIHFSTKTQQGLRELTEKLTQLTVKDSDPEKDIIVTNARHYEALIKVEEALQQTKSNLLSSIPADLIAQDIREAISHLSSITGTITSTHLLHSIFSRFCIGK